MRKGRASKKKVGIIGAGHSESPAVVQRIYVGPAITYLRPGTIFTGELPTGVQSLVNECPAISGLLVPVSDYTKARAEAQQRGSKLWFFARKVEQAFDSRRTAPER